MTRSFRSAPVGYLIATIGLSILADVSNAQFCVTSDSNQNTACGTGTPGPDKGQYNAIIGYNSMTLNTTGSDNVAAGSFVLQYNSTGSGNTAVGAGAMNFNLTGSFNSALGNGAMIGNTNGTYNTSTGYNALYFNQSGNYNTASGALALASNTADSNTAFGYEALTENTTASGNTAAGYQALASNSTGNNNSAVGDRAMNRNLTGEDNTAVGVNALFNSTGSNNTAIGYYAGARVTGSHNIDIGTPGAAGDNSLIKIGSPGVQFATFIAGIENAQVTGAAVYVTSSGQLGVLASSERYKTDVAPIGAVTKNLDQLRPVSFHLKSDPRGSVQYGLIAEEVDKIYPELVIRDDAGAIQGVRYEELAPMLLNEVQRQSAEIRDLRQQQQAQLAAQSEQLQYLRQQVAELIGKLQSKQ